jgi:hypothetical protein
MITIRKVTGKRWLSHTSFGLAADFVVAACGAGATLVT